MASTLPDAMRAVVCTTPGPVNVMAIQNLPLPTPSQEIFTRQGHSPGITFPPIVGIECIGSVAVYAPGVPAKTPMYPNRCSRLTTWGSLVTGLDLKAGESLLVRGATSSIGLCALQLPRKLDASRVGGTTRNPERNQLLQEYGADEVFVDNGEIAQDVVRRERGGFDKVLELVGTTTLRDSARCLVPKDTILMSGIQGEQWELEKFSPMTDLPNRVRLTCYGGGPDDFQEMPWEELVKDVEKGNVKMPVREFKLDEIRQVHEILESGGGGAKMVVVITDE
ncbi:putative zinc-binding oxidoreductase [Xylariomycetidae sp. FL2044]|nr:putative zinc-binding oxidoreductase [Xylariomycetidae sp. FL2044]